MRYKLYIDAFFLLNFFMDTLLLFLIRKILNRTATPFRIILGGAFGAGMACVVTVIPWVPSWLKLMAGYGCINIGMIKISFSEMNRRMGLRSALWMYGMAFVVGGILEVLAVLIPFFRTYGMGLMAVCMTAAVTCGIIGFLYERWKQRRQCVIFPVTVRWKDREVTLRALLDTGNSLYEPISHKPVSIVEKQAMQAVFGQEGPGLFRAVPFHSIGKAHGILDGYEMTELIIFLESGKIKIERPMVGLFDGKLSAGAAYQMILHPALTERQEEGL